MRKDVEKESEAGKIVADEVGVLERVRGVLTRPVTGNTRAATRADFEKQLIELRDQAGEERVEDLPMIMQQMTGVAALAQNSSEQVSRPVDIGNPYFAHMRLELASKKDQPTDILIGKRGLIDRQAGVQIVDWRDAPISQVYYRYDEGDDYEEEPIVEARTGESKPGDRIARKPSALKGIVLARRNVSIANGNLRRIGCPSGTFVSSADGRWFEIDAQGVALLEGGSGTAARAPRQTGPTPRQGGRRFETARTHSGTTQLPEIAALIDREQFSLITEGSQGLVIIQGGAGSGKTTVALHRIAYLVFNDREGFRPSRCLFVVPSDALARYVAGVLPALGVQGVPVVTFRQWSQNLRKRLVPRAPTRYSDATPVAVSRLKKHPAMLQLLADAAKLEMDSARTLLATRLGDAAKGLLALWDATDKRPAPKLRTLRTAVDKGRVELPGSSQHAAEQTLRNLSARVQELPRILSELLTDRGRLQALVQSPIEPALPGEIEELVKWCTAQIESGLPEELSGDGVDQDRLMPIDGQPLDDASGIDGAHGTLDEEDDPLLLRLYQLVYGDFVRVDGEPLVYDHIALDEAQDLSVIEVKLLYDATNHNRSLTIAGDTAQRVVFDNAFRGWDALVDEIRSVGGEAIRVRPLKIAYRSTVEVMRFARAALGPLAPVEPEQGARAGAPVSLYVFDGMGEAVGLVAEALRSLLAREPSSSVAVISRYPAQADAWHAALIRAEVPLLRRVRRQDFPFQPGVDVTDVGQVKGLEFDYVILVDVNESSYPTSVESRHLVHIGATRATHQLWIIATGPLSSIVAETGLTDEFGAAAQVTQS